MRQSVDSGLDLDLDKSADHKIAIRGRSSEQTTKLGQRRTWMSCLSL